MLTASDFTDFAHTGIDALAGRYLRKFWQPVAHSRQLMPGRALPIRVMSQDFTLYRGEGGAPHVLDFRCAHRATQLSTGSVEGDCIRCFYHGWKYDASGQCVEQPAEEQSFARKVRIGSYPVAEYLGLVFAYLGDGEAPPLPRYPTLEQQGRLDPLTFRAPYNYFNHMENLADPVHAWFVHRSFFSRTGARLADVRMQPTSWGFALSRAGEEQGVSQIGMPNMLYISGPLAAPDVETLVWLVPIDDVSHRVFFARLVRGEDAGAKAGGADPDAEYDIPALAQQVLDGHATVDEYEPLLSSIGFQLLQDIVAQRGQGEIADRIHEHLGRSDVAVIQLRRLWEQELRALARGEPLTHWTWSDEITTANWDRSAARALAAQH